LALLTQQSEETSSVWQGFEVKGWHDSRSSYGPLTDSGASATAMATGTTTFFEVIGQDDKGNNLENIMEFATRNNYSTGIVTDSYIWDATPAAFIAHTKSRDNAKEILVQIASSELDLIFGELEDLGEDDVPNYEATVEILNQRFHLLDKSLELPGNDSNKKPLAAIYAEDEVQDLDSDPNLTRLTTVALNHFGSKDQPFLLLVESEEMDSKSHKNDSEGVLNGLKSIQETLSHILDFSKTNGETLVIFTSDHETGGLVVVSDKNYPDMQLVWSTKNHTASLVPLLATGPGAKYFSDIHRNWEIGNRLKKLIQQNNSPNQ
jgi:alkaline phosphatase